MKHFSTILGNVCCLLLISIGCSLAPKNLVSSTRFLNFDVQVLHPTEQTTELFITGFLKDSSLGIVKTKVFVRDNQMFIHPFSQFVHDGIDGNLSLHLNIPDNVNTVFFGRDNDVIWSRITRE